MIKRVSEEENRYYRQMLYPLQDKILALLNDELFYLTGGTCLSRFYYDHRFSEDLDFFFDGNGYPLYQFETEFIGLIKKIKGNFDIEITVNSTTFKRAFCKNDNINLKLEFIYEPYPRIGAVVKKGNFFIDTKENIAVNKLTAIYTRKTVKDYFDLYHLLREYSLVDLLEKTKIKLVPPAFEDLIIALKESIFEGEVLTDKIYDVGEFKRFIENLIMEILQYARDKR